MKKISQKRWVGITVIILGLIAAVSAGVLILNHPTNEAWSYVVLEAGAPLPEPEEFLMEPAENPQFVTDVAAIDTTVPGEYALEVQEGRFTYQSTLQVRDTSLPDGEAQEVTLLKGEICGPEAFLAWAWDATGITLSYADGEPDFSKPGEQPVGILLTDAAKLVTRLDTVLHVIEDQIPPEIHGVTDQTIYVGDTISYKKGVTVTDNIDEDVKLEIDNSQVDMGNPGLYTVIYTATDQAGNTASAEASIRVLPEHVDAGSYEKMIQLADAALTECLKPGMDSVEQLRAIFWYVKENMGYTGDSDKEDEVGEAIRGFEEGIGDCFTYFAMMKVMMEEAGFETMDVHREGGSTQHFWSLVKVDGEWYHIDACPRSHYSEWVSFLRSDSEVEEFSSLYRNYYNFDHSQYPATPEHGLTEDQSGWEYDY